MARGVTLRELKEQCQLLEDHVLHRELATGEEVGVYRPGGASNRGKSFGAWMRFWGKLQGYAMRAERRSRFDDDAEKADAAILDALRAEPADVVLTARDAAGEPQRLQVYPKSLSALMHCHARSWLLGWLAHRLAPLNAAARVEDADLVERVLAEMAYQYQLLAWIVTTPGPGMPYDPGDTGRPALPAELTALEPWDFIRICQTFQFVNAGRLEALEILVDDADAKTDETRRPSWSVFMGALSIKLERPASSLMRDASLGELLAGTRAAAPPPTPEPATPAFAEA